MNVVDIFLVVFIPGYFLWGLKSGFLASLGALIGFSLGIVGAFALLPRLTNWISNPWIHLISAFLIVTLLNLLGNFVGFRVGHMLKHVLKFPAVRIINKLLGGIASLAVTLIGVPLIAFSVISFGIPGISQTLDSSRIIKATSSILPDEAKDKVLSLINNPIMESFPAIPEEWFSGSSVSPLPGEYEESPPQEISGQSVVKISGVAYQCGRTQLGSGAVIAPDRVVTNAHVVAGLQQVVVSGRDKGQYFGNIVYFDAQNDIAVIATQNMPLKAIELGDAVPLKQKVIFDGYPRGGPFTVRPAVIDDRRQVLSPDIYGENPQKMTVIQLSAHVEQGNSGGPVLNGEGKIVALVYARAMNDSPVGYAIALEELRPVVESSLSRTEKVDTGRCSDKPKG